MNERLAELYRVLGQAVGPHLDDERLAEVVAAEAAGENVAALYAGELAHLEACPECAGNYSELAAMTWTAVTSMTAAAHTLTPQDVFLALLQSNLPTSLDEAAAREAVAALPLLFTKSPLSPAEFDAALTTFPSAKGPRILDAVRHHLTALAAYLVGAAEGVWGKGLAVQTAVAGQQHRLQFQPAAAPAMPTLSSQATGDEWLLLSRRIGQQPAWYVAARAQRQSTLACTLTVHVDRPGLADASGRVVAIEYGGQRETAVTDTSGTATFGDVPIAALATLVLTIDE